MLEDQRLLKRLRGGDRRALRRIYEKYIDDLLRVASSLLSDPQTAEDCLHDAFVHFAQTVDGLHIRNLRSYLVSCVANRARDRLRRQARAWTSPRDRPAGPERENNPVARLIQVEESARVLKAMAKLPYEQREVFVLRVQGQMKFRQIASVQGVSVNSAYSRYRYALDRLRSLLQEENHK
jgi:RNA polymerase sigma-70 factor (ECF subfamily)